MKNLFKIAGLSAFILTMVSCNKNECQNNSQCSEGFQCLDNQCVEIEKSKQQCFKHEDCPGKADVCLDGRCFDSTRANYCKDDNSCRPGMYCRRSSGDCVYCLSAEDCQQDKGEVCRVDGTCGDPDGCLNDKECEPLLCRRDTGECVECLKNSDCPETKICDLGASYCRSCKGTQDCGGAQCTNGVCESIGECTTSGDCHGKACYQSKCVPCLDDSFCSDVEICDTATGHCLPAECLSANDCATPLGCHNRRCSKCETSKDCRSGEICRGNECYRGTPDICNDNKSCSNGFVCVGAICQPCTKTDQCDPSFRCDLSLSPSRCVDASLPGNNKLGDECENSADCQSGVCITLAGKSFCTQYCIGSNKGNSDGTLYNKDVDCPSGFQCHAATAGSNNDGCS